MKKTGGHAQSLFSNYIVFETIGRKTRKDNVKTKTTLTYLRTD